MARKKKEIIKENIHIINEEIYNNLSEMFNSEDSKDALLGLDILGNRDTSDPNSEEYVEKIVKDTFQFERHFNPAGEIWVIKGKNGELLKIGRYVFMSKKSASMSIYNYANRNIRGALRRNGRDNEWKTVAKTFGTGRKYVQFLIENKFIEIVQIKTN